jgi:SAM-dependent methyltransferase
MHDREALTADLTSSARVAGHYNADYFQWQNALGKAGGSLNAEKFLPFISADDVVLDFGCGSGWILASLSAKRKLGIDINPSARDFAKGIGIDTISSIDEAKDSAFDVVISNHSLEHTIAPFEVVKKVLKKLKPEGLAIFVVPCERYDTHYVANNIDQHLYTWAPVNLGNLFRHAGFDVVSVERLCHRWPPRVDLIDRFFGRKMCNLMCHLYALARPKLTQVRIVAKKPPAEASTD